VSVFICRWPNGDFSIVPAQTKDEAIQRLDEFGDADQAILTEISECMFNFSLDDEGQIVLDQVGERTEEWIAELCYPELETIFAAVDNETPEGMEKVREAVELERTRLVDKGPKRKPARTEIGRRLQAQTGMPSSLIDRHVEQVAKEMLEEDLETGSKKPN
jgi:hypothetical protein